MEIQFIVNFGVLIIPTIEINMQRFILANILVLIFGLNVRAQRSTPLSRSELGFIFGGMSYMGDLNLVPFKNTQLAGGLIFRYNVHSRMSLRANLLYGNVKGNDAQSKIDLIKNRNLNFTSAIYELSGGIEFNYFPFEIGHERYKGTAYILTEIGVFHMNPMTKYNGESVALQPLGTEGQGTSLSSHKNYGLTQLCIPIGVGARITLGKWACLNLELGLRKTFTDYLDDVHSDTYVDPTVLAVQSGPTAAALSNRSLDGSRYGKRGTSTSKDWYLFTGFSITFKLGKKSSCFYH